MKGTLAQLKKALEPLGEIRSTATGWKVNCPNCEANGAPIDKFNLEISHQKQVFHCWACHYSSKGQGLARLVRDYGVAYYADLFLPDNKQKQLSNLDNKPIVLQLPQHCYSVFRNEEAMKYLLKRGMTKRQIKKRNIKWCFEGKQKNSIIFPSYDQTGRLNYFVSHNYTTGKYYNCASGIEPCFYQSFLDKRMPIVVTEGLFDALSVPNGNPWLGTKANVTTTSFLHQAFVILGFDRFIDDSVLRQAKKQLQSIEAIVRVFEVPKPYEDLNDVFINDPQLLKQKLKPFYDEFNKITKENTSRRRLPFFQRQASQRVR